MKPLYDLLILGASSLAAGILSAHPGLSAVVLENTSTIAGEFETAANFV